MFCTFMLLFMVFIHTIHSNQINIDKIGEIIAVCKDSYVVLTEWENENDLQNQWESWCHDVIFLNDGIRPVDNKILPADSFNLRLTL